jgi:predicted ATPase/DNA-binding SARP family transcriptional activator
MTESDQLTESAMTGAPEPLTPFIGRAREREDTAALLRRSRVVTITGPGGAGKTRLALAVAQEVPGRRHWVTLASIDSGDLVAPTVARSLGLSDGSSATSIDDIALALGQDRALLVLDTCEHVAEAVLEMVDTLLGRCAELTILATSRTPLRVRGEAVWPIRPLQAGVPTFSGPRTEAAPPTETVDGHPDAVELFIDRARVVRPDFSVDDEEVAARVAAICRRLDGNPLAIELCAARVQVLSVKQIFDALDDSLRLLVGNSRSAPERQQTLRATLDWSHRLLSAEEAELFRRLAVFTGGVTVEGVVAVAGDEMTISGVVDLLTGLADRSMLRVNVGGGVARYELPDPVRQYAQARLDEAREDTACRNRHLDWCLALANAADAEQPGPAKSAAYANMELELPNLRSALVWCRRIGDRTAELELATCLASFAVDHGHYREGRQWLDHALTGGRDLVTDEPPDPFLVARAINGAGVLAFLQCDYAVAVTRLESSRAAFDDLGDERGAASVQQTLSSIAREQGDYARAEELLLASLYYWTSVGDVAAIGEVLSKLAFNSLLRGDVGPAEKSAQEGLAIARRTGDSTAITSALIVLGGAALASGDLGAATAYLEETFACAQTDHLAEATAYAEEGLGLVAYARGNVSASVELLLSSLQRQHELGDHWRASSVLVELAACQRLRRQPLAAARLLGAAESLLQQIGGALAPIEQAERQLSVDYVEQSLSKNDRNAAWMSGRSASLSANVAEAVASFRTEPAAPASSLVVSITPPAESPHPPVGSRAMPRLALQALGREIVHAEERILTPADFSYAKPRELLFFLAAVDSADKSQIGLALWPDATAGELRSAFHTTLHHLRKAVGAARVVFQHGNYRLNLDHIDYDVTSYTNGLAEARAADSRVEELRHLQRGTQLYRGDYLPSLGAAWTEPIRDELRHSYQRALMRMGRVLLAGGGNLAAIEAYRRVIASDPLNESAHRELMRCYATVGEPSRAIQQYERLAALLRDELGTSPADSTTELQQRILSSLGA